MNANAFIDTFDEAAHGAFLDAGLAAVAAYTPPSGGATPDGDRRCYVNDARQTFGDAGAFTAPRTVIGVLLADGAVEKNGTLVVGSATYKLQKIDETDAADDSLQWWVVTRV